MPAHPSELPAKKQSKWSAEEDALIIDLRGGGMKWEDISKRLPGRSAISCRLHYQNYLERRSEWDEERKNKLARLYERFKPEMWSKVAEEMAVPWRAAEAMHWQLGEADMARRAGVVPFSLSSAAIEQPPSSHRRSPPRGHTHPHPHPQSHSQTNAPPQSAGLPPPSSRFAGPGRGTHSPAGPGPVRSLAARRESLPRSAPSGPPPPPSPLPPRSPSSGGVMLAGIESVGLRRGSGGGRGGGEGRRVSLSTTLPPIPIQPILPSVAEMTTGMSPYNTPAYSVSPSMGGGYASSGPPGPVRYLDVGRGLGGGMGAATGYERVSSGASESGKRRKSPPDMGQRESTRRRH